MLVLSRNTGETIIFPQLGITITFAELYSHKVKVGIDAPRTINIVRGELLPPPDPKSTDRPAA